MTSLHRTAEGWSVQLRYGKGQRKRFAMPRLDADREKDLAQAEGRRAELQALAALLAGAAHLDAEKILETAAGMTTARQFAGAIRAAKEMVTAPPESFPAAAQAPRTFPDVAELWLSGELHRRFPDVVRGKNEHSVSQSRGILRAIYPHLDKPVSEITKADVLRAKADATPQGISQSQRAHYARHIRIVMSLAVEPLGLIEHSPVPPKFVPPYGPRRALGFLYPEEDILLLGAPESVVPYRYRLYYGFLGRNGCRPSEGLRLTYGDLDLRNGVLTLDVNKTKIPRAWKMADDVTRVLRAERERTQADDSALVFPGVEHDDLAERFREHLWDAGVRRRELHAVTSERRPIRVHDLRASFVTIALAHGANEDWVMSRTGHTTSAMLSRYRRQADHAREIELGWYADLGRCLSGEELAGLQGVARGVARKTQIQVNLPGFRTCSWSYRPLSASAPEPNSAELENASAGSAPQKARESETVARVHQGVARAGETPGAPAEVVAGPTTLAQTDPVASALAEVEATLGRAIDRATAAGEWETVRILARELEARRLAREAAQAKATGVSSLDAARRKRDDREGGK